MNRTVYYSLITVVFGIISIPTILSIIFQEQILIQHINRTFIKMLLIFFICIVEASYINQKVFRTLTWVLTAFLFYGLQNRIMHWSWANETIIGTASAILILLSVMAFVEKNKNLLHYLLFFFVLQRLAFILTPPHEAFYKILWWVDVITGSVITIVGVICLINPNLRNSNSI